MQCCPLRLTIIMLSGRSVKRTTALNNPLWWRKSFQLQNPKGLESQIHQLLYILLHHLSLVRKQIAALLVPNPECSIPNLLVIRRGWYWFCMWLKNFGDLCDLKSFGSCNIWDVSEPSLGPEIHLHLPLFPQNKGCVEADVCFSLLYKLAMENTRLLFGFSTLFTYWQSFQMNFCLLDFQE